MRPKIKLGIESLLEKPPSWLKEKRVGLLVNQASIDSSLRYTHDLIFRLFPKSLKALFGPQHGIFGEKQDNMKESSDLIHPRLKIPVYSLYGKTRTPTRDMLDDIDVLIIDLQDVGTRVYTFISTVALCLRAAFQYGKKIVVLDRPDPIGGSMVEGNLLKDQWRSFVGIYPVPMRHGMTIGEIANYFNNYFGIDCELEVIPIQGWRRKMDFTDTGLIWAPPSPNMPSLETALVYPGQVLLEGTNLSEGRGTTRPLEIFGAPFIDPFLLRETLKSKKLKGVYFREIFFQPTFNKWQGKLCGGLQIHVTNRQSFKPFFTTLTIIQTVISLYPDEFSWIPPPYEYEYEKMPIDLIIGDKDIRKKIEQGDSLEAIEGSFQEELGNFIENSRRYHLYR